MAKVKDTRKKLMAPIERSCHKEYTHEIVKIYLKLFENNGQG